MRSVVLAMAVALFSTAGALADDAVPPAPMPGPCLVGGKPADPQALKAAADLMKVTGVSDSVPAMIDTVLNTLVEKQKQIDPNLDEKTVAVFVSTLRDELNKSVPLVIAGNACIYANHYSADEMRQLVQFYQTPLGRKLLAEEPGVTKDQLMLAAILGQKVGVPAVQKAIAALRAKGVKI